MLISEYCHCINSEFGTSFISLMRHFLPSFQEKQRVQEENSVLKLKLSNSQEQTGAKHDSMTIMKQTLTQIKERLEKKEKKCLSLEKTLRSREVIYKCSFKVVHP